MPRSTSRSTLLPALPLAAAMALGASSVQAGIVAPTPWDYDNDGYRDLAVGAPFALEDAQVTGRVYVLYGAPSGLDGRRSSLFNDTWPGVSGALPGARFGWSVASCNLNADQYADLAIGAPGYDHGDLVDAGAVFVALGTADGFDEPFWLSAADVSPQPTAVGGWQFGYTVACGDLWDDPGDADDEIVATMPGASALPGAPGERGLWSIIDVAKDGSLEGIGGGTVPMPAGGRFGAAVVVGRFHGGTYEDIAFGVPRADESSGGSPIRDAGRVIVVPGGDPSARYELRQKSRSGGVADDRPEKADRFGEALAAGDLDHDGYDDLVVGAPREDVGSIKDAGLVHVFLSRDDGSGLQRDGEVVLSQESPGVPGVSGAGDRFGAALVVADFGGPGTVTSAVRKAGTRRPAAGSIHPDLAVGLPGQLVGPDVKAGAVVVLYWRDGVRRTSRSELWTQDSTGVQTSAERGDAFGASVAGHPLGDDVLASLAVGVPLEDDAGLLNVGQVHVLPGSSGGLFAGASQVWRPDLLDPPLTSFERGRFGHIVE